MNQATISTIRISAEFRLVHVWNKQITFCSLTLVEQEISITAFLPLRYNYIIIYLNASARCSTWSQNPAHVIVQRGTQRRCALCGKEVTHKLMMIWTKCDIGLQELLRCISLAHQIVVCGDKHQSRPTRTCTVQTLVVIHLQIVLHAVLFGQICNIDNLYAFRLCACDDCVFVNILLTTFVFCRKECDYNKLWDCECSPGL